jgi:hypothetical protein
MQIKTGDEPALKPTRPPQLLLTTPESFDSLLANRPRMLKDVTAVVLDEIHLLDNTARGDQVRILLNRLRRLRRVLAEQAHAGHRAPHGEQQQHQKQEARVEPTHGGARLPRAPARDRRAGK